MNRAELSEVYASGSSLSGRFRWLVLRITGHIPMPLTQTYETPQQLFPLLPAGDDPTAKDRLPRRAPVETHKRPTAEEVLL